MEKNKEKGRGLLSGGRNRRRSKRNAATNRGRFWLGGFVALLLIGLFWGGWVYIFSVINQSTERVILSSKIPAGMARILSLAQILADVDTPLLEPSNILDDSVLLEVNDELRKAIENVGSDLQALLEGDPNRGVKPLRDPEILKTLNASNYEPLEKLKTYLVNANSFLKEVPQEELNQFHERGEIHPLLDRMQHDHQDIYPIFAGVVSRYFQEKLRSNFIGLRFVAMGLFFFPVVAFIFVMVVFVSPKSRHMEWEKKQVDALNMYSRAVLENTSDAIFFFNHRGLIQGINDSAKQVFQMKEKHIKGNLLTSIFPKMQIAPGKFFSIQDLKSGKDESAVGAWRQTIAERGDGSQFHVNLFIHELLDPQTERKRYIAFVTDMTGERKGEADLTEARKAAEVAEAAKSEFLNMISHETLTPMIGIVEPVQALLETPLSYEQREYVEMIRGSGNRLLKTINEMLDFSSMQTGKISFQDLDFNLDEAVRSTLDSCASKPDVEITSLLDQPVPLELKGDPGRLRQALTHLVDNAVKFTEQGRVLVRVSLERDTDSHVKLRFIVRDSGIGIAPEEKQRLFEAFYQVDRGMDRRFEGIGLGLAICKGIVDQLGGQIGVESELGKGATFWFTALFKKQSQAAVSRRTEQNHLIYGARILLVSDSPADRYSAQNLIIKAGFASSVAVKSSLAIDGMCQEARMNHRYHVVLFDHSIAELDALKLIRQIRSLPMLNFTRLVFLTKNQREIPPAKVAQSHLDAVLKGPLTESALVKFMKDLLPNFNPALPTLPPLKKRRVSNVAESRNGGLPKIGSSAGTGQNAVSVDSNSGVNAAPGGAAELLHEKEVEVESGANLLINFPPPAAAAKSNRVLLVEENLLTRKITLGLVKSLGYDIDACADFNEVQSLLAQTEYGFFIADYEFASTDPVPLLKKLHSSHPGLRHLALGEITEALLDCIHAEEVVLHGQLPKPLQRDNLKAILDRLAMRGEELGIRN